MFDEMNRNMEFVPTGNAGFGVEGSDIVPPDPARLIDALRQIGYSLEQAISDLVDNSISAGATHLLIRFLRSGENLRSLAVVDDGRGMTARELTDAMRFGSSPVSSALSLGKFGMGLKLASLSYARALAVVSVRNGRRTGRRWTLEGIRNGWECERIAREDAKTLAAAPWSPIDLMRGGTLVKWDDIDKLPVSRNGIRTTLRNFHRRLELHLGLHFHRFLESGRLRIFIDQQELGEPEHQVRVEIPPLNPFGYPESGALGWPRSYHMQLNGFSALDLEGNIWPPNSEAREYRLGGRSAARQGFYFYRNDRLIQAGGWNGIVESEAEPHSSLARVRVDLPPSLDEVFSLNVQKSAVIVPNGFTEAVKTASCDRGSNFDAFRYKAEEIYRQSDNRAELEKSLHPAKGIPARLSRKLAELRGMEPEDTRPLDFKWRELDDDELFRIDRQNTRILLNARYRSDVLAGLDEERNDVPLFKMMLYMLLETHLTKARSGSKREKELAVINRALIEATSYGKG
ncbi:ATP-binding protein [Pseudomonadota bacterium]